MKIEMNMIKPVTIVFMAAMMCCSCAKHWIEENESEYIQVKLGFSGDISVFTEPLSKASSDGHLYGVQVYYDHEKDGVTDDYYGYGLFDNTADMVLSVLSGYTYRFVCTAVLNGKNVLYCGQYGGNSFPGYGLPFQTNSSASTMLMNEFVLGPDTHFSGLTCGAATVKMPKGSYQDQNWPAIERLYGELDGVVPSNGDVLTINIRKCFYAIRFILKGVDGGSLRTTMNYPTPGGTEEFSTTSDEYDSGVLIRSFYDVKNCSDLSAVVNWNYTDAVFEQWNLSGSTSIALKRNTLTTVTVSVTPDNAAGILEISEESFGEDNPINLYINSDGLIDIYVDPNYEDD